MTLKTTVCARYNICPYCALSLLKMRWHQDFKSNDIHTVLINYKVKQLNSKNN